MISNAKKKYASNKTEPFKRSHNEWLRRGREIYIVLYEVHAYIQICISLFCTVSFVCTVSIQPVIIGFAECTFDNFVWNV